MRGRTRVLAGMLLACVAERALAGVEVIPTATGGATIISSSVTSGPSGAVVIVNAYGNPDGGVIVQVTTANEPIQSITVVPQVNPPYSAAQLGVSLTVRGKPGTSGSVGYLGSIARSGTNGDLIIQSVTVAGDIGDSASPNSTSLVGQVIGSIVAAGDIAASVEATGAAQRNGNITTLESTGGRILGNVRAAAIIATQIKAATTIGTSTHTVNIGGGTFCNRIEGTSVYANINDGLPVSGVYGSMGQLAQLITSSGVFKGSIKAASIRGAPSGNSLETATDLDADITLTGDVGGPISIGGDFVSGRTFKIGGGIINADTDNGSLHFGSGGLKGQVIVNSGGGSSSWGGSASVDSTTMTPLPFYAQKSSDLGGGAIGLAPFRLYANDCDPPRPADEGALTASTTHTSLVPKSFDGGTKPVVMRFYGPIRRTASNYTWSTSDIVLKCIPLSNALNPCSAMTGWYTIDSGNLEVAGPANSGVTGIAARTLSLGCSTGRRLSPGVYRVTFPGVRCAGVEGNPLVIPRQYCPNNDPDDPYENDPDSTRAYYFRVGPDCDDEGTDDTIQEPPPTVACPTGCADYDGDNGVEVADIFDFLNEWFAGCCSTCHPPAGTGCINNADFNENGVMEVQDIFDFLQSWFLGDTLCP